MRDQQTDRLFGFYFARFAAATLATGLSAGAAQAAAVNWTDATGFWDVAANWSSNPLLPGAADDVTINVAGIQTVTVRNPNNFTINSLSIPGDDILAITGGSLTVSNAFTNNASTTMSGGTLTLNGVSSMGSLTQSGGQIAGIGNLTLTGVTTITNGGHSGAGTTFAQAATGISGTGLNLDGGRVFQNTGTVTQTNANINLNSRNAGAAEAGNGTVVNAVGGVWNSNATGGTSFIIANSQGGADTGAGAVFTNQGTFNKLGAALTDVRTAFINTGSLNVQAGQLQFGNGGALTHNGTISVASGATLDFASGNNVTQTVNTATTTIDGTLSITGDNFVNFTQAHTLDGTGTFQQNFGQVTGGNLTLGPTLAFNITDGGHSGAATTTVQGTANITGTGLRLDGGRIFRNEGTVTQTNANVDMNSRRSGAAEAGNGTVVNAVGGVWNSNATGGTSFIIANSQGGADTGAGAVFTNQGTFNKLGAALTDVRTAFINTGSLNVQAGQLQFGNGGALTHNGTISVASGATLDFASGNNVTQTVNTATTTIDGTLSITGDNFVNFTQAHTLDGTGTFQQNFGQVTGGNLTLGPTLAFNITDGGHSGAATTTVQGTANITGTGLRLDGGRIFRNEGTVTQTNANVDMNSRRSGAAEAGNGTVVNAVGGVWNSNATGGTSFIIANSQGGADTGAGAVFTNQGTFNKLGAALTDVRTAFINTGSLNVQAGQLQFGNGGALTHNGTISVASGATLDFASGNNVTQTVNTATTTIDGTLSITGDNFVNFTQAHTLDGTGTFQQNFGQVTGGNLTLGPTLAFNITDGGHSGAATTTVQGTANITGTGLRLDGGRIFRNEGTVTQTNANVDMNSRRSGAAEAGNGTVVNAVGGVWNSNATGGTSFIIANSQGGADTGAGAVFTNQGTFNKLGAALTDVRTAFINTGSLNVQAGQLQFGNGGALTHNGTISVASGATLDFASGNNVTQTVNTATTTIDGTLSITGDNFVNFTQAHTLDGTGTFQQNFGQVTGGNLTLGPTLAFNITDGGHSGAATTTVQGTANITGTGLRLDGGRIFRNEGTVTQTNANVDMNSRRSGAAEAGNGSVVNAVGGVWNSNATSSVSFIIANSQGGTDTGAGAVFTNQGTFNKLGARQTDVRTAFNNSGLVDAQSGTLRFTTNGTQGTGTLQTSGGILEIQGASTTGNLFHNTNAANSLILGANTLTVSTDYNNANFGVGDAFNRRANVSTTGTGNRLIAAGDANQGVSGAGVTNGTTAAPVLVIGNVHVGATTFAYNIDNTGTTGPALRGAIQTGVNGGSITDARLSGSGVTAGNWGPLATGASLSRDVVLTVGTAGVYAPISGQAVSIVNNFDNTRSQVLTIASAAGAGAYNLAAGNAAPSPVTVANQRVGGSGSQSLTVSNTAPSGSFTEGLNASFGANTGNATNNGGTINLLAGGANNGSAMSVGVDASSAGAKSGTVTLNYVSDGTGTSGLGLTNAGSQIINVSGNVYRLAQGAATPTPVNFGNRHVGDVVSQVLTVQNTAANDGFSESLNASFGANSGAATNNGGSLNLLAAGGSNASAMSVGLDTSSAGAKSGSVSLNYASDGSGTSGLAAIAAGGQSINVSGNVYRLASANTLGAVNFGNVHVGDTVQQALNISNTAIADGFSESLNASFGASSDARITTSGSISQLAAGSSNTSMIVGLNTSAAGTVNGTQTINFASDGTGSSGLGITALPSQIIGVSGDITTSGSVFRLASASPATPNPVNFGNVRVGTAADQVLSISNTAANDGFSESLNASISSNGAPVTASGSFNLLGPTATDNTSLHVGIDTSTAGAKSGSATIALVSDGTGTSGLGTTNLASQTVNVSGNVYRLADPVLNTGNVTLAARVGDVGPMAAISISNSSPDAFTEGLKATTGAAPAGFNVSGNIANLAAGATDNTSIQVELQTLAAGNFGGALSTNFESTGAGTTGAADVSVGSAATNLVGRVYQAAVASVTNTLVDFGIVHVGDVVSPQALAVKNDAPAAALNDFLRGNFGGASGPFTAGGGFTNLAVGDTDSASLVAGLDTATAGVFNGTATASFASHNPDLADLALPDVVVALTGQVNNFANPDFDLLSGSGSLGGGGLSYTLDLGNVLEGSGIITLILQMDNDVAGPADLIDGAYDLSAVDEFILSGFGNFADLGAGQAQGGLQVSFDTNALGLGLFTDTVLVDVLAHNASGFEDRFQVALNLRGQINARNGQVPEPESLLLVAIGFAALMIARRRRTAIHR